jgi:hypothetical protein
MNELGIHKTIFPYYHRAIILGYLRYPMYMDMGSRRENSFHPKKISLSTTAEYEVSRARKCYIHQM